LPALQSDPDGHAVHREPRPDDDRSRNPAGATRRKAKEDQPERHDDRPEVVQQDALRLAEGAVECGMRGRARSYLRSEDDRERAEGGRAEDHEHGFQEDVAKRSSAGEGTAAVARASTWSLSFAGGR
jgi:hypothetical protein